MAVTAGFVVAASLVAERSGPAIGAMIATLPIAAAPSYVFLALDHDTAFIARSALGSLSANAVTGIFTLVYVVLAQRQPLAVSLAAALAVWFALAFAAGRRRLEHRHRRCFQRRGLCGLHPVGGAVLPRCNAARDAALV